MKNKEHREIMGSVRRIMDAKKRKKELDEVIRKENLVISNYMFSCLPNGMNSFVVRVDEGEGYYINPIDVKVTCTRKKTFIWDFKKLYDKIGKIKFKKVVDKSYIISDYEGLVRYLKSCGVDPKKFKSFINSECVMNLDSLDYALQIGDITKKDIDSCYRVELGTPYIRVSEQIKEF